ncbi:MAG: hypothetical protein RJA35_1303, partial [Actinomycetota bacterium]
LQIRLPRVLLAGLVGAALAGSGSVYQTVFRNPLADPYLLGVASGAGLGATIAIVAGGPAVHQLLPVFAFIGGLLAVAATFSAAGSLFADPRNLLLAGVAIGAFATAVQTYIYQAHTDALRQVYSWIFGQLTTADWPTVISTAAYLALSMSILILISRKLDALLLGDDEAISLGVNPRRIRLIAILAATFATATAVAASGLIGFVGLVVPHLVRLLIKRATNLALPAVMLAGGAFLILADLLARTVVSPAELPLGVITAFIGGPFFLLVLRARNRR